ncbi:MAG: hypothetical protein JW874_06260 [Spirochaetales bacterium]|nr:hypothetical protein [Spirochaetales bacterium]
MEKNAVSCTWKADAPCASCANYSVLHCKWDKSILALFGVTASCTMLIHIFGLVITGIMSHTWQPLVIYLCFFPFFFLVIEGKYLCSHCPYWAEDSAILHCLANHGLPKLFKYNPAPVKKYGKAIILASFLFGFLCSIVVQSWNILHNFNALKETAAAMLGLFGVLGASVLGLVFFASVLFMVFCSRCVNFNCPLNRVPKKHRDEYLKQNPVIREAWEKAGYTLG